MAAGYDICTVQELLGHKDVHTTMLYTHVLQRGGEESYPPYPSSPQPFGPWGGGIKEGEILPHSQG
ncbi:MAG TPA: tyrosine-type recombinase/integrase [Thermoflexus sp.]|nr:tyrosine-type recombinase/integrase [Thermoflexus sp.]